MSDLLYKLLPMILSMALSQFTYIKIDDKYKVTNRVSSKLNIKQQWKALFCYFCTLICILIWALLGIYVIDIPIVLNYIMCGLFIGIGVSMTNKMKINKI